jgi:hypothetical protein
MKTALTATLAFAAAMCPARAALVVSTAPTSNVTCSAGVCSAAAADAVLNVKDLKRLLAAGDVTVASGSVAGDIVFAAKLQWTKPGRLTLDAYRGIAIGLDITSEGTGGVTLTTDDGGSGGELVFTGKGKVSFWGTSSSLIINGTPYTLVDSIKALSSAAAANPSGAFALSRFYDASADGVHGHSVVTKPFGGTFEGLGHTIENFDLAPGERKDYGFFAEVAAGGAIRDLTFENPVATLPKEGIIAVLAGDNHGTISHVNVVNAAVSGNAATAGGLVGRNDQGTIAWCAVSGSVSTGGKEAYGGGLVGWNIGTVTHASSSAVVTAPVAGGLVGYNQGPVTLSSATGDVGTSGYAVTAAYGGGLAGENATGGAIDQSFATGTVHGADGGDYTRVFAGGVTTVNAGTITNAYSTAAISVGYKGFSGGFALSSDEGGSIGASYSTGANIKKGKPSFGFADDALNSTNVYWDTDTSGTSIGCKYNCTGVTGLTTAQLQSGLPAGFDPSVWAQSPSINNGWPYLIANPPQ